MGESPDTIRCCWIADLPADSPAVGSGWARKGSDNTQLWVSQRLSLSESLSARAVVVVEETGVAETWTTGATVAR